MNSERRLPSLCLVLTLIILVCSLFFSRDRFNWILEVFPALIGIPILVFTYKRFQFTNLVYALAVIHVLILATGGVYTYAKVPLGFWMQHWFGFARNHYDRIGHFAQGFIPAVIFRELLLRTSPMKRGKWLFFIVVAVCLGISAFYELIEFASALSMGASADSFLGSQGDIWDAQWDMTFALIGASCFMIVFTRVHDRFLTSRHEG